MTRINNRVAMKPFVERLKKTFTGTKSGQDKLIEFVADEKTMRRAVNGSIEKRLKLLSR